MKNIHTLPTNKTSRLQSNRYSKLFLSEVPKAYADCINQNIYITSDGEIKEGDWFYNSFLNEISKMDVLDYSNFRQKIILTTDDELIADGVQDIDDEFLEWFVKNPSCEEVEAKRYSKFNDGDFTDYKIIIPKEEPKQETLEEFIKRQLSLGKYQDQESAIKYSILAGAKWQAERMYSEEEVELIANEMVNWAIDNVGNPNPQSGKKFDEVIIKFKNK